MKMHSGLWVFAAVWLVANAASAHLNVTSHTTRARGN